MHKCNHHLIANHWQKYSFRKVLSTRRTELRSSSEILSSSLRRADCIFIQPVWEKETIATLVKEINAPINILSNPTIAAGLPPSVRELQDLGVARLSLGSSLMKATLALIKKVAGELSEQGTFNILLDAMTPLPDAASAYKMAIGLNK
jgi:2-methylisocitrate lyase-like PEP mutase family enzyme